MVNKKNVLLFLQEYGQGGAEKVAYMLADMLHNTGQFNVTLCSLYAPVMPNDSSAVPRLTLGLTSAQNPLQKLGNYFKALTALRKLKRSLGTHLTISSLWPCDWLSVFAGRDKKIAIIQINILNNPQNVRMVQAKGLVRRVYNACDRVVLGGANLWPEVTGFFKIDEAKLRVIQNPINSDEIVPNLSQPLLPRIAELSKRYKLLVAANRLHDIKNTAALIRIYQGLPQDLNNRFLIMGEGDEKAAMQAAITAAGLRYAQLEDDDFEVDADFFFINFQKNPHHIIQHATAFVFPTKGEGLPLALIESMYCRVPVIASDCPNGGIFEIMQGQGSYNAEVPRATAERTAGGYLMPVPLSPESDEVWRDVIITLNKLPQSEVEAMKDANRRRSLDFDMPATSKKWLSLIGELL